MGRFYTKRDLETLSKFKRKETVSTHSLIFILLFFQALRLLVDFNLLRFLEGKIPDVQGQNIFFHVNCVLTSNPTKTF